jgi:hypothetical protein
MPAPLSEGGCTKERMMLSVMRDVVHVQWGEIEAERRAFLIYCLLRLRIVAHAGGRDATTPAEAQTSTQPEPAIRNRQ